MTLEAPYRDRAGAGVRTEHLDRHTIANGITAFLFATTGPLAILVTVAVGGGLSVTDISSWVFAGYGFGGVLSIIFSLLYRQPLGLAWTIPGTVLLIPAFDHLSFAEIIGAYLATGVLIAVLGVTGLVGRIMAAIPMPVVMGMVAGVFLPLAVRVVTAFGEIGWIAAATLLAYLVTSLDRRLARLFPPVLAALIAGGAVMLVLGRFALEEPLSLTLSLPRLYVPEFSARAMIELVLPLAIAVIGIQNAQGIAILRDAGFAPPTNALTLACGLGSLVYAAVGSVPACVTGPVNGILNSSGEKGRRYMGGVVFGVLMILFGLLSTVATKLALALPAAFIGMLGGLALLPVLQGAFLSAFGGRFRLGALISFIVTVSDVAIFNVGAPVWGLVFGFAAARLLEGREFESDASKAV